MENVEALITRATTALCFVSEADVLQTLVEEDGMDPSEAWLVVKAAVCQLRSLRNEKSES